MLYKQLTIYIIGFIFFVACEKADNKFAFPANKQIAHRGYWTKGAAENSLQAVQYAIDAELYGAEIDVHETKDGIIVVNHDQSYEGIDIPLHSYEDIIDKTSKNIPVLEDFLILLKKKPRFKLIIEIKSMYKVSSIINLIDKYDVFKQVEFISFDAKYCEQLIDYNPTFVVGYLGDDLSPQYLIDRGYSIIDSSYYVYMSNPQIVIDSLSLGLRVYTWTINDIDIMSKMYNMGVQCITTDIPVI